jgi:hypothetical protein
MSAAKEHGPDRDKAHADPGKRWSRDVTEHSDALDLEEGVFTRDDPKSIARSLMRSAQRSDRRQSSPYRSAMSMLTFYINRAGSNLPKDREKVLEQAKDELRQLHAEEEAGRKRHRKGESDHGHARSHH